MKKYLIATILTSIAVLALAGCSADKTSEAVLTPDAAVLTKITAEEVKAMMDSSTELVVLDVRTQEEFDEGYIENAILIPDYELKAKAEELLTDKNVTILVYCRSGRRSAIAAQVLNDLGYSSIYDFGGIIDWPYEVIITP